MRKPRGPNFFYIHKYKGTFQVLNLNGIYFTFDTEAEAKAKLRELGVPEPPGLKFPKITMAMNWCCECVNWLKEKERSLTSCASYSYCVEHGCYCLDADGYDCEQWRR